MKLNYRLMSLILALLSFNTNNNVTKEPVLIFKDDFSAATLSDKWIIEASENDKDPATIVNGQLQLNTESGITVWYKNELKGNILIEFDRIVVIDGGKHDRLSDLNQFWMATDPQEKMFTRKGGFREYDSLQMYYVGMGGNYNTTTRMRRYDGNKNLKIVGEFTDAAHLLKPNYRYHVVIKSENGINSFTVNNEMYFSFKDEQPFTKGWFAIRSTKSRQMIDNIKIWQLN
ncbi:methyltransferase [Lacibacter luteus]|uniref:Methyltransferase n=1 Tax=Lacibacter luteus TaxID=2508719 RepID=A0A4Q1CL94_9BACT|nr:DUF6250 domain-containing protein [Lacibacter luteus]RXK61767.1 methyltransferase [Lacibacter luteus]